MQTHHFSGILLLLALMPISILASCVSVDSVIDLIIQDFVSYLTKYGAKYHVQSLGSLARSCPFTFIRTVPSGGANYKLGICFNVTELTTTPPIKVSPLRVMYTSPKLPLFPPLHPYSPYPNPS
ncbi:hypothetical protein ECG_09339 [Echinococcus granulosus]|nr:hypothetical protein ECG_09339 [Echinococcus granulosus]